MSTTDLTPRQKVAALTIVMGTLAVIIGVGLLLREHGPGNMGTGFLQGAAAGLVAALVMAWRAGRHRDGATTFERAFTQQGDERDDAVLTRAFAVLGLLTFPVSAAAVVAIGLGAHVPMVLFFLLIAQVLVFGLAFASYARRM